MSSVAFDLDDTLLHDDLTISDFTVHVLRELRLAGWMVVAASGRAQMSMKPYIAQLDCVSYYISCNGAEIWDSADRLMHREKFSADTAQRIAYFAEKYQCYAQTYDGCCFYYNRPCVYADLYASRSKLQGVCVGPLSDYIREPRNKILMIDEDSKIEHMYAEAVDLFGHEISVTRSKPCYLEFNPLNATKGKALEWLSVHQGLDSSSLVAFGDSLNDLSMIRFAGTGVAVSNGWETVREQSHDVCASNNLDGPAHYLNEHFLNGKVLS